MEWFQSSKLEVLWVQLGCLRVFNLCCESTLGVGMKVVNDYNEVQRGWIRWFILMIYFDD